MRDLLRQLFVAMREWQIDIWSYQLTKGGLRTTPDDMRTAWTSLNDKHMTIRTLVEAIVEQANSELAE